MYMPTNAVELKVQVSEKVHQVLHIAGRFIKLYCSMRLKDKGVYTVLTKYIARLISLNKERGLRSISHQHTVQARPIEFQLYNLSHDP
ncbi:hypothetical protein HanXRQr2_Chr04g0186701 [Helianthus annuus]|uniref:Uncharacterized protein n=1 Tax=Helianthus annuus TaxID=4232 RepID=A0A9K3JB20_HELAN|nr:hypothetical protein HanXRQr2_Chr04g0186701 [Helianthus annuus]